jgi:hypothetical protein
VQQKNNNNNPYKGLYRTFDVKTAEILADDEVLLVVFVVVGNLKSKHDS